MCRMRAAALWVLAVAGCGDQLSVPDAPAADGGAPAVVAFQYLADPPETPAGWPVFFQNADGSLVSAQRTTTDGRANAFMAPGGSVTVVLGGSGRRRLWTYTAVEPGDELVLDLRTFRPTQDTVTLDLRLPRAPAATSYQLFTTCGQANLAALGSTLVMLPKCAPATDLVAIARGGNGTIVGGLLALGLPLTKSDVIVVEGGFTEPIDSVVTVEHVPPTVTNMVATHGTLGAHDLIYTQQFQFALPSPSLTFTLPQGRSGTIVEPRIPSSSSQLFAVDWRQASEHAVLDLGPQLPDHDGQPPPTYTPADRTIRWTEQARDLAPDLVIVGLTFRSPTSLDEWQIVAPHGSVPAVRLPAVPDRRLEPDGTAAPAFLLDAAVEGGYAAGRERVLGRILSRPWPMEGPSGRAIYQVTVF